jgi:tetratricopeptide (TPR) repeat protein
VRRRERAIGIALAALLAAAGLGAGRAEAGMLSLCDEPAVFPGAALNVVVLPYKTDRLAGPRLSGPAQNLGLLLQLNSLLTLGRYGSLGAVYLHAGETENDCPPEEQIEAQLLDRRPGAGSTVKPGNALVLLWGRIYQEGTDIYLQSYLRFLRRGEVEGVERRLPGGGTLRARTPAGQIAFPPRRLTENDLHAIEEEFQSAARVYRSPNADSPSEPLPLGSRAPVAFGVDRVQDGWLQVSGETIGTGRWLKARIDLREWPLRQKMPELDFLDAVAGYLQYRIQAGVQARAATTATGLGRASDAIPRWVEESLDRYREGARGGDPVTEAMGRTLLGNLQLLAGHPEAAEPLYRRAAELLPESADVRNLEIVARLARLSDDLPRQAGAQVAAWLDALALEPANLDVLENLAATYELGLRQPALDPAAKKALADRLDAVKKVRAGILTKRPPEFGAPLPPGR